MAVLELQKIPDYVPDFFGESHLSDLEGSDTQAYSREMSENLAWAAGFWDGEGHVSARDNSQGGRQIKAQITQKDRRVLDQFQLVTGLGKVYPRRVVDQWQWQTGRVGHVKILASLLWPWLGDIKREQFIHALGEYSLLQTTKDR